MKKKKKNSKKNSPHFLLFNSLIALKNKFSTYIYLLLIIIVGFYLRTFNVNWDGGFYFHPDERAIVMFTVPLQLPKNLNEFLSPASHLNPHFFAYGNFPLYILRFFSELASHIDPAFKEYSQMYVVGRIISASFDTFTIFVVFLLASSIFSKRTGLFAALSYALFVFPIQSSHFFTVDTMLTFFMTGVLLLLVSIANNRSSTLFVFLGLFYGLALATKISAFVIFPLIFGLFFILLFRSSKKRGAQLYLLKKIFLFVATTLLIFVVTQPYALIDFQEFVKQTVAQSQMSKDPFVFPYTLQYVGKIPFLYEFLNIFLWGVGPLMGIFFLLGFIKLFRSTLKKGVQSLQTVIVIVYFLFYFILFGSFAVGWMRYMLPIYPILALFCGWLISEQILTHFKPVNYATKKFMLFLFLIIVLLYPVSFITIYTKPNTRIQASNWINNNIPYGSSLAVEHWDDALPVYGMMNYQQITLPLYDRDTPAKWQEINQKLKTSDYIIIASKRLYIPLQKLTDCKKLPSYRCYPITARYYKDLFSGKLGFSKVAEFVEYPTIPFINFKINDFSSDETFTVSDHPKVMIFKKTH